MASKSINEVLSETELWQVLSHLSIGQKMALERVCRKWRDILIKSQTALGIKEKTVNGAHGVHCQEKRHFVHFNDMIDLNRLVTMSLDHKKEIIIKAITKYQAITALYIEVDSVDFIKNEIVAEIKGCLNRLEHLEVKFFIGTLADEDLMAIVDGCHSTLRHLILVESNSKCIMYPKGCPDSQPLGEVGLKYLFEKCPQFELLQVKCRSSVSGACFESLGVGFKSLSLTTWLSDEDVQTLVSGNGSRIEALQLMAVYEEAFHLICTQMVSLKKLTLDHVTLSKPSLFRLLENLRDLQSLNMGLSGESVDEELPAVLKSCSGLKQINLTLCGISDHSLVLFSQFCPLLEKVEIYNYSSGTITDRGLRGFQQLSRLRVLAVPESDVTDEKIRLILDSCPRLCHLNLTGCKKVTRAVTEALVAKAREVSKRRLSLSISEANVSSSLDIPQNLSITKTM